MTAKSKSILVNTSLCILGILLFWVLFFGSSGPPISHYEEPGAQYQTTVITKAGTWRYRTVKPVVMRRYPQGFILTIGSETAIYPNEGVIKVSRIKLEK